MVGPYPDPGKAVSGGVERVIDTLLPAVAMQVEVTLVVPGADQSGETRCGEVRVVYLKKALGFGFINYWTIDSRRIRKVAHEIDADVVHVQGAAGWGLFVDKPKVLTVHGIAHRDILTAKGAGRLASILRRVAAAVVKLVERKARRTIGNIIVINPYVLDEYRDVLRYKNWEIANPIDPVFVNTPLPHQDLRRNAIVIVGKVCSRKNTLEGVRVACQVLRSLPDATLLVAGDVSDQEYLDHCKSVARELGVDSRTRFMGNLSTPDLVRVLDESSVMLMTSRQETAPMAIVEAHSRGVPTIAPDNFGIRTMIEPGCNGFFLPSSNFESAVHVLWESLLRKWDRVAIANDAREKCSVEAVAGRTVQVYRDLVGGA